MLSFGRGSLKCHWISTRSLHDVTFCQDSCEVVEVIHYCGFNLLVIYHITHGKSEERIQNFNLKYWRNIWGAGLDLTSPGCGHVEGCCEHDSELWASIKDWGIYRSPEQLSFPHFLFDALTKNTPSWIINCFTRLIF